MPFISADEVKAKRDEIKGAYPEYTFSIRCVHNSTISVTILEGPIELLAGDDEDYDAPLLSRYVQVNPYHFASHYEDRPELVKLLSGLKAIAARGKRELVYDSDYGSVPTFYVDLNIGAFGRPYTVKVLPAKTIKARKARAIKAIAANEAKAAAKAKAAKVAEEARLARFAARSAEIAAESKAKTAESYVNTAWARTSAALKSAVLIGSVVAEA